MISIKQIVRNVFSNWTGYVVNIVISFFISPFVVHTLGNTGYGIWVLVGSITGYLGILDLGMRPAIVKFVSRYKALNDDTMVNKIVNTMLLVFSSIAALVILASLVLAYISPKVVDVPAEFHEQFRLIVIIVGLNVAASFPFGVFNAVLNALQRFDLNNIIEISVFLARSACIVIFLKLGGGLVSLAVIILAASLVSFLIKARWCLHINKSMEINFKRADKATLKMITGFSIYTFIIGIAGRINFQTDSIVIGTFMNPEAITFFAIGATMIDYLTNLVSHMSTTITPVASGLDATRDDERMRKLLYIGTKYCMIIIFPVGITFLILGDTFINLWMGPEYGGPSGTVLTILMWANFGYLSQFVSGSIFYGLGKVKMLAILNLGMAFFNILISILLVKPYGINGVAWGTAIPLTVYGTIILPLYVCRTLKISLLEYLIKSYLVPFIPAIIFGALIWLSGRFIDIKTFVLFWSIIAASFVIYSIFAFFVALEKDHRQFIISKMRLIWGTKGGQRP